MEQHMYVKTTSDEEPPGTAAKGKDERGEMNNDEEAERKHDSSTGKQTCGRGGKHTLYRLSHRGAVCG